MKKAKLLKALQDLKVKLECRKKKFELWQEQLEEREISEINIIKTHLYWTKQRRLEDRIEEIQNKIDNLQNKYSLQIFTWRKVINA